MKRPQAEILPISSGRDEKPISPLSTLASVAGGATASRVIVMRDGKVEATGSAVSVEPAVRVCKSIDARPGSCSRAGGKRSASPDNVSLKAARLRPGKPAIGKSVRVHPARDVMLAIARPEGALNILEGDRQIGR